MIGPGCAPSISKRLARTLALVMLAGLGLASTIIFFATAMRLESAQREALDGKMTVLEEVIRRSGGTTEAELLKKVHFFDSVRTGTWLLLRRADGSELHVDPMPASKVIYKLERDITVAAPGVSGGLVHAHAELDVTHDTRMLKALAVTLVIATLLCAALSGMAIRWLVLRELRPLRDLAAQTRAISPQRLDQRLVLACPAEELMPWIEQFNALMARLELAYAQLEAFNADVAHELRTPLATLIGQTEVALSRERPVDALRETLVSNLEEMQRLSTMVNDMLFLSHADRGAVARRGAPVSLATLARQVVEFHEAPLEEAGLALRVEGDAEVPVDESLFKRALSNLLGNATRFARRGSTVVVRIAPQLPGQVQVEVCNEGEPIDPGALPRLFDRFFRAETSRACPSEQHHGLGLAIVAAIARMHAGRTLADSGDGVTRVGFTLAV